ncbi:hypothetical protein [Algoriphagus taiwanensis]|uniref:Outer membrane protein beta-barrel domain-containing protein n=1 Tax=Algoriphagus taiwanensis TaxID=1445656 RepID=A0ABQ6Q007_9BACT|nr:hypothetical protein Ataiwa_14790 [Algoriphagus taiwanensis]
MKKKYSFAFLLFFSSALSVFSQTKTFSGERWSTVPLGSMQESDFVILASGEKVFGTVIRNYNMTDYPKVEFEAKGVRTSYLPKDLEGFGLTNGQLFYSRVLPDGEELVFLQVMVSGAIELSKYRGRYFLDNGSKFEELIAKYDMVMVNNQPVKRFTKPYIATLKNFLTGECGVVRYSEIDKLTFGDQAFVSIIQEYLQCSNQSYEFHLSRIPSIQVSPIVGLGFTYFSISPEVENLDLANQLGTNLGYSGFVGVRFHDLRVFPRFSTELRVAFSLFETTLSSSYSSSTVVVTGTETLRESAIYIPWSFQYSLLKKKQSELYLGFSAGLWFGNVETSGGMVDERFVSNNETMISEVPITQALDPRFIPVIKLGTNFRMKGNRRFFTELEWSTQGGYYQFSLINRSSEYARQRLSVQFGIEF